MVVEWFGKIQAGQWFDLGRSGVWEVEEAWSRKGVVSSSGRASQEHRQKRRQQPPRQRSGPSHDNQSRRGYSECYCSTVKFNSLLSAPMSRYRSCELCAGRVTASSGVSKRARLRSQHQSCRPAREGSIHGFKGRQTSISGSILKLSYATCVVWRCWARLVFVALLWLAGWTRTRRSGLSRSTAQA